MKLFVVRVPSYHPTMDFVLENLIMEMYEKLDKRKFDRALISCMVELFEYVMYVYAQRVVLSMFVKEYYFPSVLFCYRASSTTRFCNVMRLNHISIYDAIEWKFNQMLTFLFPVFVFYGNQLKNLGNGN